MNNHLPDLTGQKVLITGGLGFIGSNLARQCHKLGAKITIFDCLDPRSGGNLYNISDIKGSIELCFKDILNFDQISEHIINKDIIFNCAASTSHSFSMKEPWIDMNVNSRGVINLLEAVRRFNKNVRFIHIGTTTQLGPLQYEPADEKHPEFPTDIYSANKSASEKYVLIYSTAYQINASVLRLSNVFGPRASIHSPEFTFNNYFIGLSLQNKKISLFGTGEQKRNVIFVYDAVNALVQASQASNLKGKVLFAVGDSHYSVAQIAEHTVEYLGTGEVVYTDWPKERKLIEVGDAIISNKNIKNLIDWKPEYSLKDGLLVTKKYFKSCLEEYLR